MNTPIAWDLSTLQPESHEAWVCASITEFFQREDESAHLISLWKLNNYHYNIGIYVPDIAVSPTSQSLVEYYETASRGCSRLPYLIAGQKSAFPGGSIRFLSSDTFDLAACFVQSSQAVNDPLARFRHYIVVKYGMQFFFMRRNEPLNVLLALDGDDVFTDFLERVMGKVIEPTEEQISAFVEQFPLAAEQWLQATMNERFRDHPSQLHDYRIIQAIFGHFDDQRLHRRAERYILHWWEKAHIHEFPQPEWKQIGTVLQEVSERLSKWWKGSNCVDYSLPPPPAIDHDRRRAISDFTYKGKTYKRVEVYGQVAVIPVMMEFHSREKPGYDLVDLESHKEISSWLPTNPGGRDAARDFARQVSRLTDMTQVPAFSRQQMYGAEIRIHDLLCGTYEKYAAASLTDKIPASTAI